MHIKFSWAALLYVYICFKEIILKYTNWVALKNRSDWIGTDFYTTSHACQAKHDLKNSKKIFFYKYIKKIL